MDGGNGRKWALFVLVLCRRVKVGTRFVVGGVGTEVAILVVAILREGEWAPLGQKAG